jgi:hypothetical protein
MRTEARISLAEGGGSAKIGSENSKKSAAIFRMTEF